MPDGIPETVPGVPRAGKSSNEQCRWRLSMVEAVQHTIETALARFVKGIALAFAVIAGVSAGSRCWRSDSGRVHQRYRRGLAPGNACGCPLGSEGGLLSSNAAPGCRFGGNFSFCPWPL